MFEETLVRLLLFDLKGQKFRNNTGVNMGIEINLLPIKKGIVSTFDLKMKPVLTILLLIQAPRLRVGNFVI